jgi:AcrR family transcriptional regulator
MSRRTKGARAPTLRKAIKRATRAAYHEAILEAAERVFVRDGYHETKMADVAAETGVSVGTLYNYFESKELVFASIIERGQAELDARVDTASTADDPLERVRDVVRTGFGFIEERGALFTVFMQIGLRSEADIKRVAGDHAEQGYQRFLGVLQGAMEQAAEQGRVRADMTPAALAGALAGMSNGFIFAWLRSGRKESLTDRADDLLKLFLEGAKSP